MANQKKEVEVTYPPQPVEELLGIAGERTAVQFVDMLSSAIDSDDLKKHSFRIELEYQPNDGSGPSVWYRICGMGREFSEMLGKKSFEKASSYFD